MWWDPALQREIERAGAAERLFAYHICDWLVPTTDLLNDRGMMGDGVIDLPLIRGWMEAAGYRGLHEVEIFSADTLVAPRSGRSAAHLPAAARGRQLTRSPRAGRPR